MNICKKTILCAVALFSILFTTQIFAGEKLVKLFPEDTAICVHVNCTKLLESSLLQNILGKFIAKFEDNPKYIQIKKAMGFDLFADLTSATLAISKDTKDGKGNFRGVLILKGDFNTDKIIKVIRAVREKEGKGLVETICSEVTIYYLEKHVSGAFLDDNTLLIGDPAHVRAAIRLAKGKDGSNLNEKLVAALAEVDTTATVWAAAYMAPKLKKKILKKNDLGSKMIAEIAGISISANGDDGIDFTANITFRNSDEAEGMVELLSLKLDVAKAIARHIDAIFLEVLEQIKVSSNGDTVEYKFSVSAFTIAETIKDIKALKKKNLKMISGLKKFFKGMKKK